MSLSPPRQFTPGQLTIVDLVDRILDKGVVITGDITISIVGVDLLSLKINLVIASLETAKRYGIELPWEKWEREKKELKEKVLSKNIQVDARVKDDDAFYHNDNKVEKPAEGSETGNKS